jgi:Alpha-L-arabinofuranosidase B, catalytic
MPVGTRKAIFSNKQKTYILDGFTDLSCAFGLIRLKNNYTGSLIQVRRTSDGATLDLNVVSEETLTTFGGGSDLQVTTLYDQSVNGYNLQISDYNLAPYIYKNSNFIKINNKLAIDYYLNKTLENSNSLVLAQTFAVAQNDYSKFFSYHCFLGVAYNTLSLTNANSEGVYLHEGSDKLYRNNIEIPPNDTDCLSPGNIPFLVSFEYTAKTIDQNRIGNYIHGVNSGGCLKENIAFGFSRKLTNSERDTLSNRIAEWGFF